MNTRGDPPGALALDFLNTVQPDRGRVVDRVGTPAALLTWLEGRGPSGERLASLRASPADARLLHLEAFRLRGATGRALEAFRERRGVPSGPIYDIDRVLAAGSISRRLTEHSGEIRLTEQPTGGPILATLAPFALAAARVLTCVDPRRLRRCASPRCRTWFVDTSKGGRRKWCSMARCGNRAKAAKHRRGQRARQPPGA